ncbi:MAG TPA: ROK family protein [Bryobacteraceae bacterium]|nr:ROK family protein [Bryobacteraceae bacterium]
MPLFGGIEAGGTTFRCARGTTPQDAEFLEFPTHSPEPTVARAVEFFRSGPSLDAIGIASFGPIDPNPQSPTSGYITSTPKVAWRNFNFAGAVRDALKVPVAFDTDVNAAALAESQWGAARGLHSFLYITVGTGLGGAAFIDGRLLHGRQHPEMGHIRIPHDRARDPFPGNCPYHGDCFEGLAAGPAIEQRWGTRGEHLPDAHAAWDLEAEYLALGFASLACSLSPQRIVVGGGVARRSQLFPTIRLRMAELLNGYIEPPAVALPELGTQAGALGALQLARHFAR